MKFDRLARGYDFLEWLTAGKRLQRARTSGLAALAGARRVLSVGEGHGRFAAAFTPRFPSAELTCVEASAAMLARAQRRLGAQAAAVHWVHAAVETWVPSPPYDAIVTCFFLDCFPPAELGCVIRKLAASTADSAVWVVVDFAVPPAGIARWRAQAVHALMYAFFRIVTHVRARRLTPPDPWLIEAGFRCTERTQWEWGLIKAEVWRRGEAQEVCSRPKK